MNETALPFVTFVIPARNEESNIEKCILGIKGLDYPQDRYEIIVADGRSGDGTADIARSLGARVISNDKIIQSAARNIVAKNAKGELLAFLDADNVLEKDWLRKAVAHHFMGVTRRDKYSMYYKSYNHIYFWKSNFKFTFCFFLREFTETLLLLGASLLSFKTDYLYGIKGKMDAYRKYLLTGHEQATAE